MPSFEFTEFTAEVNSPDTEVISERAMYFNYNGKNGGHVEKGVPEPKSELYFAEGYAAEEFDTYVLTYNPNDKT